MKVLIVGLGSIAKKHIDALKILVHDVELYALRSVENADNYEDVINLYALQDIGYLKFNFIIVSSPTSNHFEVLSKLQHLNTPLFIEKPLFSSVGEKEDILVEQIYSSLPTYVACNLRFLECLQEIKKIVKHKRINEINIYCGSYLPDWRPGKDFRKNYSANKDQGGGVHIDLIHELDYLCWIFGPPLKTQCILSNNSSLNISAFDYANYTWMYNSFTANIILNYFRKDAKRTFEIVCEDGTYLVDILKNEIYFNKQLIFFTDQTPVDTYIAQMKYFINEILNNGVKFNSIKESYEILKLCLNV